MADFKARLSAKCQKSPGRGPGRTRDQGFAVKGGKQGLPGHIRNDSVTQL
jgi:hypothetical protein